MPSSTITPAALPDGIRERIVPGVNGLSMNVLEAGENKPNRPCVLLLHGFPELAYSWRRVLPALAAAGYYAIAPDQRGYGATTGWDADYDGDLASYRMANLVVDALALVKALGRDHIDCVIGHDFGSPVAGWCALVRPDVFRRVVLMSAPFTGAPQLTSAPSRADPDIHAQLLALPRPRKHYQWYYGTRAADADMRHCPQGVHGFLRAYYHHKSADWADNKPRRLAAYTAEALAELPTYYVMDAARTMPETVAEHMPSAATIAECTWLRDDELAMYSNAFARTGFQGGLQWYRAVAEPRFVAEMRMFAGRQITVPSMFIAGKSDWGVYQTPGAFERLQDSVCTDLRGVHLLPGAGHWVQQERAVEVNALLLEFLRNTA